MDQQLERLELTISKFLRAGVLCAGALMLIGWIGHALGPGVRVDQLQTYATVPLAEDLRRAREAGAWYDLVTYVGLVVLILLPFTRVVLTAVLFVRRREWLLAGIAAFVAFALVASVVLGIDL